MGMSDVLKVLSVAEISFRNELPYFKVSPGCEQAVQLLGSLTQIIGAFRIRSETGYKILRELLRLALNLRGLKTILDSI